MPNSRAEPQPSPPELLAGRFQVLRAIGHGAGGGLALASDREGGAQVVIKRGSDPALVGHEADVLAALAHPGIVRLLERHDRAAPPFLVLEPVEGLDLEAMLLRHGGTLDAEALGRLLLSLCDTLAFIHGNGFLHRDLKPANILVRPDGSPVVVDFGAALAQDQAGSRPWSFVTEGYAAPEQYFADQREGPWTDLYGLGALAYRALAGKAPPAALIRAGGAPGEPLAAADAPAPALRKAIDWALEPEAADRPQAVAAWRERLADALAADAPPPPAATAGRPEPVPDDYPPTIRVARARTGIVGRQADRPTEPPSGGRRRAMVPLALILGVVVAAAALAAATLYGWPLYERYLKMAWQVDQAGGGDALTIAGALARAPDDAVITIGPGTYRESLRIERPANLVAGEGASPLVAPESGPCALVTSATGSIVGLSWQPAAGGEGACLVLAGGAITLERNRIAGGGVGLEIRDGADPVVRGNRLEGAGLVVTAGGRGTITGNSIVDAAGASLVVRGGADPSLGDNVIEGGGGVVFAEGAAGSLVGNRLLATDATGIRVTSGAHPRVIGNTIEGAREAGIFVYDGGGGRFEDNTVAGNGLSGMVIAGSGRPELVANRIRDNAEHGVLVLEGGGALVEGNAISANQGHGIALGAGSEVELADNQLDGNDEPQLIDAR